MEVLNKVCCLVGFGKKKSSFKWTVALHQYGLNNLDFIESHSLDPYVFIIKLVRLI